MAITLRYMQDTMVHVIHTKNNVTFIKAIPTTMPLGGSRNASKATSSAPANVIKN